MKLELRGSFSIIIFWSLEEDIEDYFPFAVPAGTITAANGILWCTEVGQY